MPGHGGRVSHMCRSLVANNLFRDMDAGASGTCKFIFIFNHSGSGAAVLK